MSVEDKIRTIRALVGELEIDLEEATSAGLFPEDTIADFNELKKAVGDAYNVYVELFKAQVETTPVPLEASNGAQVEIKTGSGWSGWKHKELIDAAINRILERATDFDTGEVVWDSERCLREFVKLGNPSWRVTALPELGLSPEKYATPGEDKTNVVVTRSKK